ncbi:MAG: PAS domain-containing protein, partial [Alphaproteobacteria bacterium]|nr:PAS domain-containing protein [Alphaproteobacteria bacterium]
MPVLLIGRRQRILYVNPAAEQFFDMGAATLAKLRLDEIVPFGSPVLQLLLQVRERGASAGERDMDLTTPRYGERIADVTATPVPDPEGAVILTLQERSLAQ